MGGFVKMSNDVVGTIRSSVCLPDQLKTKAIGVFFTLSVLVDWDFSAAHVRSKKHLVSVCGGNAAEIELILGALEKLNLIAWARSSRCWVLAINPYARHKNLGSADDRGLLQDAVNIYKEAKTCGALSEYHYGMIDRFIDDNSAKLLKSSQFTEPEEVKEDDDGEFGGFA